VVSVIETEKIGTSEWIRLRAHGGYLYLPLSMDLIRAFRLRKGDLLKVRIEEVQRAEDREAVKG